MKIQNRNRPDVPQMIQSLERDVVHPHRCTGAYVEGLLAQADEVLHALRHRSEQWGPDMPIEQRAHVYVTLWAAEDGVVLARNKLISDGDPSGAASVLSDALAGLRRAWWPLPGE